MISFARQVKEEIIGVDRTDAQYKAELAGILQFLSTISITRNGLSIVVRTGNPDISRFVLKLVRTYYNAKSETSIVRRMRLNKNKVYILRITEPARTILEDLGLWTKEGLMDHPARKMTNSRENAKAYLAGCFLASGSVNDPHKANYHLEMSTNKPESAQYIMRVLKRLNLPAKMIERRAQYVVYMKSADYINDFLAYTGASVCALQYADIKIQRDYYNSVTRLENCQTANVVKAMKTGQKQIDSINQLKEKGQLDKLDPKLAEVAQLRLDNPEASLQELADLYVSKTGQTISKSGMKHRLARLSELAQQNMNDKEDK